MASTPYRHIPFLSPVYRAIRKHFRRSRYAGSAVLCPVCERQFSSWLRREDNGSCPECGSETRHRFLWLTFCHDANTWEKATELLHLAPELCLQSRLRSDQRLSRYVTADRSAPNADYHTDITALVFADGIFDALICSHVLEHVPDDASAIHELFRVLRPGGVAYIQVPLSRDLEVTDEDFSIVDPAEREKRYGQFDHVRLYGRDFLERLRSVGFIVEEYRVSSRMSGELMRRYGLWDDSIFVCKRPALC